MVASTHWLASQTGMAVLERGGNAFDAAVAAGFVLQVVEPHLNGPGGEVPGVFWSAERGEPLALCGQGVAPAAATIERFRELGHELVPGTGVLAACVPGAFGGWLLLLREFGTWRIEDVLEFAIGYAEHGYPLHERIRATIELNEELVATWPGSRDLYLPAPEAGALFRNASLAATYRRIVEASRGGSREEEIEKARRAWYEGFVAEEIDRFCAAEGGLLTGADMAAWHATLEPVATFDYRGLTVCKTQPWAVGPVGLQQLALLQGFDLAELSTAELVHVLIESGKLAFADRDALYGDSAEVPLETLLSTAYNDERRGLVGDDASDEYVPGLGRLPSLRKAEATIGSGEPGRGTVHLDIADRFGNMISATPSGGWLQSSPVIPALGWPLGTRAQMFWLEERASLVARAGKAAPDDAEPRARASRRRAVPGLGHAGRGPAGAVGVARVHPPCRPRARPAGGDRRAGVPHGPPDLVVLPARVRSQVARARVAVRRAHDPRSPGSRSRRDGVAGVVGGPGQRRRARARRPSASGGECARHAGVRGGAMTERSRTYTWDDPLALRDTMAGRSGLELMQMMVAGDLPPPPIAKTLGFRLVEASRGHAVFECEPAEYHYNPIGIVHAGLAMTLMDSAMGLAFVTTLDEPAGWTTLEVKANFTRALTVDTGAVRCTGSVVHPGRRVATTEARIEDSKGRLFAHGTSTILVLEA